MPLESRPHSPALILTWALLSTACGPDVDSVRSGSLCAEKPVSGSDCRERTLLEKGASGSNLLDITLRNTGPTRATFTITLDRPSNGTGEADAGADAPAETGTDVGGASCSRAPDPFPVARTYRAVTPSGTGSDADPIEDRFVPAEIRTADRLVLDLSCDPERGSSCRGRLDWVLSSRSPECQSDGDCRRTEVCDESFGTCVQCVCDRHCSGDRTCNTSNGRCEPPASGGCVSAPTSPWPAPGLVLLAPVLLALRSRPSAATAAALAALLTVSAAPPLRAAPPDSSIALEAGPRLFSGSLAGKSQRGIGARLRQTIRGRHVGGAAWLEANYFVTSQRSPPLDRQLQVVGVGIGPRIFLPLGDVDLFASGGYTRMILAPNSLVRATDERDTADAFGGRLGAAYHYYRLKFELAAGARPMLGLDSTLWTIDLAVGFTTR